MTDSHFYTTMESPLGEIALTSDGEALTGLYPPLNTHYTQAKTGIYDPKPFKEAIRQLNEYFAGTRRKFDLPLSLKGTEFQKRVWKALQDIKPGETKSYSEVAQILNMPRASRAVGTANGRNPICIIVPCHRVIAAGGGLGGYNGGIKVKQWLLQHERSSLR